MHSIIAKNTLYQAITRVITSIIGFVITVIIARRFGVLGFGDFTIVTSYVAIFYLVIDFGLNAFFIQYEKQDFRKLFYLRLLLSFLIFVILNLIAHVLPYNPTTSSGFSDSVKLGILIFSITIFSQSIIISASSIFQKSLNYFNYMLGVALGSVANLVLVLTAISFNLSIYFILVCFVISNLLTSYVLIKFSKEKIFPFYLDIKFAKEILILSMPIGLMLVFNLIYFRADIILLALLSTTKDVGIYGLSYKFFDFLIALPLFLSNAVYPFLIKEKSNNHVFSSLIKKYFLIFLLFSIIIAIPFWFISPLFSFIKTDFVNSIIPFRILLISLPFFFLTSFFQWVLITRNQQKYLMYVYLISTILNIFLNLIFIPKFSYIASATITVISEGLVFMFLLWKIFPLILSNKKYV